MEPGSHNEPLRALGIASLITILDATKLVRPVRKVKVYSLSEPFSLRPENNDVALMIPMNRDRARLVV